MNPDKSNILEDKLDNITDLLADITVLLISNGANSARTTRNLIRIAESLGYHVEHFFSHSAIIITVLDPETKMKRTVVKRILHHGVNYSIVSEVSILSWKVAYHEVLFEMIGKEIESIKTNNYYPEWLKIISIGLATAALCQIFDGNHLQFLVVFLAAAAGMIIRMVFLIKKYNHYISWFIAAFVSTSVVNVFRYFGLEDHHAALSACVLWLIPGVPLVNGFLDVLGGHIISGWAKLAMGTMLVFMIAVGFYLSLIIFGYGFSN